MLVGVCRAETNHNMLPSINKKNINAFITAIAYVFQIATVNNQIEKCPNRITVAERKALCCETSPFRSSIWQQSPARQSTNQNQKRKDKLF